MSKPAGSDDKRRQTLLLYDHLDREEQSDSTLPERKAQIAITLRRLEREYYGDDDRVDVLERRNRMRTEVAQVKASPSPWNGQSSVS